MSIVETIGFYFFMIFLPSPLPGRKVVCWRSIGGRLVNVRAELLFGPLCVCAESPLWYSLKGSYRAGNPGLFGLR